MARSHRPRSQPTRPAAATVPPAVVVFCSTSPSALPRPAEPSRNNSASDRNSSPSPAPTAVTATPRPIDGDGAVRDQRGVGPRGLTRPDAQVGARLASRGRGQIIRSVAAPERRIDGTLCVAGLAQCFPSERTPTRRSDRPPGPLSHARSTLARMRTQLVLIVVALARDALRAVRTRPRARSPSDRWLGVGR